MTESSGQVETALFEMGDAAPAVDGIEVLSFEFGHGAIAFTGGVAELDVEVPIHQWPINRVETVRAQGSVSLDDGSRGGPLALSFSRPRVMDDILEQMNRKMRT